MFRNTGIVALFDLFLNPDFDLKASFASVARNLYAKKDFGIGSFHGKYFLILKEVKTSLKLNFSLEIFLRKCRELNFKVVHKFADIW